MLGSAHIPRVLILLTIIVGAIAFSAESASAASIIITTPTPGSQVAGDVPFRAELQISKNTDVLGVRFRIRGEWVKGTDHHRPYMSPKAATADLTGRPPGPSTINVEAEYEMRNDAGKESKKKVKKSYTVNVIDPTPPPAQVATAPPPTQNATPLPPGDPNIWKPVFNDEFESATESRGKWLPFRWDWIKGRRPYNIYEGAGYRARNIKVTGGAAHLKISSEPAGGLPMSTGSMSTNHRFAYRYGYIEARIRVPKCDGCWPAFWMLPEVQGWPPEIDTFEFFDTLTEPYPVSSLHRAADNADNQVWTSAPMSGGPWAGDYTDSWHTYGMYWAPDQIRMFIDRIPGAIFTDPLLIPSVSMYPIIQLAVINGHTPTPGTTMQIDWVHVFQQR
jgi:beta-glucanase (GH16 family)